MQDRGYGRGGGGTRVWVTRRGLVLERQVSCRLPPRAQAGQLPCGCSPAGSTATLWFLVRDAYGNPLHQLLPEDLSVRLINYKSPDQTTYAVIGAYEPGRQAYRCGAAGPANPADRPTGVAQRGLQTRQAGRQVRRSGA